MYVYVYVPVYVYLCVIPTSVRTSPNFVIQGKGSRLNHPNQWSRKSHRRYVKLHAIYFKNTRGRGKGGGGVGRGMGGLRGIRGEGEGERNGEVRGIRGEGVRIRCTVKTAICCGRRKGGRERVSEPLLCF